MKRHHIFLAADDAENHDGERELGLHDDGDLFRASADPPIVSPVDLLALVEVLLIGEKRSIPAVSCFKLFSKAAALMALRFMMASV